MKATATTTTRCSLRTVFAVGVAIAAQQLVSAAAAFHWHVPKKPQITAVSRRRRSNNIGQCRRFFMGLYDDDDNDKQNVARFVPNNSDNDDSNKHLYTMPRLFDMRQDGTEARQFLPRLSRTLESGIGCYFEPSDRTVQSLSKRVVCHPMDAAWALEACKGNVKEAWLYISTAQAAAATSHDEEEQEQEEDFDEELFQLLQQTEEQERQEQLSKDEATRRAIEDAFSGGKPNQDWLPKDNPKPIDDEPWFTG